MTPARALEGHMHAEPYEVVGVLEPTGARSIWQCSSTLRAFGWLTANGSRGLCSGLASQPRESPGVLVNCLGGVLWSVCVT